MALRRILVSVSNNTFRWGQLKKIPVGTRILTTNRAFSIMADPAPGNQVSLIAAVQLTCGNDKDKNMKLCNSLIEQAVAKKVKMVFLPEAFDFIGSKREETLALAETLDGPVISNYRDIAKKLNVWLSLGGFHLKLDSITQGPRVSNVHLIIDCNGEIVAQYSKVHLFDVSIPEKNVDLRESNTVKAGSEIVPPVTSPVGNIGLAICYDLRFPEFSDKLRRDGAEILTYPSAFTIPTGEAHWEPLLRARAIENQCFVVAAAQVGSHNDKRSSYGHSMIINPWGKILAEAGPTDQLIFADIDLKSLQQIRRDMPVLQHKRMNSMGTIKRFSIPQDNVGEDLFEFGHVTVKTKMIFLESNLSRAFVNKKCILPGHVLVISKRKVNRLHLLSDEEVGDLFLLAQKVGIVMEKIHGSTAANVACQDGKDAGQSVAHVHIHVLPRRPGDLARSDQIHEDLEKYVHDEDPPKWRTEEDMLEESNHIRSIIRNDFSALLALN